MSKLDKMMDKQKEDDWQFAKSRNVDYGKLVDFISNNQIKQGEDKNE